MGVCSGGTGRTNRLDHRLVRGGLLVLVMGGRLLTSEPAGAVNFDDKGGNSTGAAVNLLNANIRVQVQSNRYSVFLVAFAGTASSVTSVTVGGSATGAYQVGSATFTSGSNSCKLEMWAVNGATATGMNVAHTVNVSPNAVFTMVATSWYNVHQTGSMLPGKFVSAGGSTTPASVTVPTGSGGEVLVDGVCFGGTWGGNMTAPVSTAAAGQTELWNLGVPNGKLAASHKAVTTSSTTNSWTLSGGPMTGYAWAAGAARLVPASGTAVMLDDMAWVTSDGSSRITWRTGFEVDNLGFHVYRESGGRLFPLTSSPIPGSAWLTGAGHALGAGQIYSFEDRLAGHGRTALDVRYWLEEIDLSGRRTRHGPIRRVSLRAPAAGFPTTPPPAPPAKEDVASPVAARVAVPEPDLSPAPPSAPPPLVDGAQWQLQRGLAGRSAVKLVVERPGWFEVRQPELLAAGLPPGVDARRLALFVEGQQVPIVVSGEEDGRLDAGDSIGFAGRGQNSPYTAARIYWLAEDAFAGQRISGPGSASATGTKPSWFPMTLERRPREIYFTALLNEDGSNFFGPMVRSAAAVTLTFPVRHLAAGAGSPELEVALQGASANARRVAVRLGGQLLGHVSQTGRESSTARFPVTGLAADGEVSVNLQSESGEADVSLVDFVRLTYPRAFSADAGRLDFAATGGDSITLTGFTPGVQVQILDATSPMTSVVARGPADGTGAVSIVVPGAGPRRLLARAADARPDEVLVRADHGSRLYASAGGDLLVIAPVDFHAALDPWLRLRRSQGWTPALVDPQDIYDEGSYGAKHPGAIREFISRARADWSVSPKAVVLVGDASFDPRNYLGKGEFDLVPTKLVDTAVMETASDDWLADDNGDGIADLPLGRLPVRTARQLEALVSKLMRAPRYRTSAAAAVQPLLFVTDENDEKYDFRAATEQVAAAAPMEFPQLRLDRALEMDGFTRLKQLLGQGPLVVTYVGHGSQDLWPGGLLSTDTVADLPSPAPGEFWLALTCLNGMFQDAGRPSLAETLLGHPDGGAFGVWASSGFTEMDPQVAMGQAFLDRLLGAEMSAGAAAIAAKAMVEDMDVRRTWILFGDPTWQAVGALVEPPDASAGEPVDAGAAGVDAGAMDGVTRPPADAAATDVGPAARQGGSGCGCTVGGRRGDGLAGIVVALVAWCVGRRRRRR